MKAEELIINEKNFLRTEQHHLKTCQLQYFALSITATGLILGLGSKLDQFAIDTIYLAPLAVVLPCWWIFFDKATTISRIVGYFYVLEEIAIGHSLCQYIGWERSLFRFREKQRSGKLPQLSYQRSWGKYYYVFSLRTPHRYWVIVWYAFLNLALLCLVLGISDIILNPQYNPLSTPIWVIALCFFAASVLFTAEVLMQLTVGRNSYEANRTHWQHVLT